jgi:cytochrome c553
LGSGGPDGIQRQVTLATCAKCHHPPHTNTFDFADRLARIVGPGHGQKVQK